MLQRSARRWMSKSPTPIAASTIDTQARPQSQLKSCRTCGTCNKTPHRHGHHTSIIKQSAWIKLYISNQIQRYHTSMKQERRETVATPPPPPPCCGWSSLSSPAPAAAISSILSTMTHRGHIIQQISIIWRLIINLGFWDWILN